MYLKAMLKRKQKKTNKLNILYYSYLGDKNESKDI